VVQGRANHTLDGGALAALAAARKAGVRLSLDGDKIVAEARFEMPDALVEKLRAHRLDVLHILKWRAQPPFGAKRQLGCTELQWDSALLGLHHFLADGWSERAQALGWSEGELFHLPALWSQIRLTGAAWLIGEWNVVEAAAEAITVKPPWSESQLKFYRQDDLRQLAVTTRPEPEPEPANDLVEAIVACMADKVEVSATLRRLLAVMGRPADVDESVLLDEIMMLADALYARGVELRFDQASGHVVLGLAWAGCPRRVDAAPVEIVTTTPTTPATVTDDEAAITRFKAAAEAVFGPGVEVVSKERSA
jgi:hypothetical protein